MPSSTDYSRGTLYTESRFVPFQGQPEETDAVKRRAVIEKSEAEPSSLLHRTWYEETVSDNRQSKGAYSEWASDIAKSGIESYRPGERPGMY